MPHSTFLPDQRPDLGSPSLSGSDVHGWHPMLV